MSHFTVLVKVSQEKLAAHGGNLEAAVGAMMAPYQENNMGTEEYLEFNDVEEEHREQYKEDTWPGFERPDGTRFSRYGDEYRKLARPVIEELRPTIGKGSPMWGLGIPEPREASDLLKERLEEQGIKEVELPMREVLSWQEYMEEWCGYQKDPQTGRYGYWENPNKKWDSWRIGGRWRGKLRVKEGADSAQRGPKCWELQKRTFQEEVPDQPHTADFCLLQDLDLERMEMEARVQVREWFEKYENWQENPDARDTFYIMRQLQDMGLSPKEREITLELLQKEYLWYWMPSTHSVVDANGWHEPGQMGWFGFSSENPDQLRDWRQNFADRFLREEDPRTWLVICDCHI